MRKLIAGLLLLLLTLPLHAQTAPKLEITQVRVGFSPSANFVQDGAYTYYKANAWTPVFVDITAGKQGWKGGGDLKLQLSIETADNSDTTTVYTVPAPIPSLAPGQSVTVLAYTKPASTGNPITAILRAGGDTLGPQVRKDAGGLDAGQALYLLVGSDLPELRRTLESAKLTEPPDNIPNPDFPVGNERTPEFAAVADSVDELPDLWFGYDAIDLVVLTTGRREFLDQLAADGRRRAALAQWVLRGGHLLVSVGKNQDAVAGLAEIESLLPVRLAGVAQRKDVNLSALAPKEGTLKGPVEIARLEPKPGRALHALIGPTAEDSGQPLLVAQAAVGLGRVTVVAFDLEQPPFAGWAGRSELLLALISQAWPRGLILRADQQNFNPGSELLTDLANDLERFEEVPVISFGWVALFIFIYILIVGPLDYWFLKHVVKRLELTWITFPTVVILISVIAYFTAYQIKGRDLRIRKLDLVDIDLRGQQAYGHTWLTLFSPRIENYTIGLEPAAAPKGDSSVLISWLGRPTYDRFFGGSRGQSFFRRAYDYAPSATGLERVPILVWTTKSFTSTWSQSLAAEPLIQADLKQSADNPNRVAGTITWRPGSKDAGLDPQEAHLIVRGRIYPLKLTAGQAAPVDVEAQIGGQALSNWSSGGPESLVYSAMFFQEMQGGRSGRRNNGLRELDQSWRLAADPAEVVLVLKLPPRQGAAQEVNQDAASPTRLWLGALPASGGPRPELAGVMRQETYVRVFVPVTSEKK